MWRTCNLSWIISIRCQSPTSTNIIKKRTNSYFCSVLCGEDIILGPYSLKLHIKWRCEHISLKKNFLFKLMYLLCDTKVTFHIGISYFLEKPWQYAIRDQSVILYRTWHVIAWPKRVLLRGGGIVPETSSVQFLKELNWGKVDESEWMRSSPPMTTLSTSLK